ncbi:hypothetical protein AKJ50_02265, partial [candidate division MSBL1 archaeon SCGC-AAA382A13]
MKTSYTIAITAIITAVIAGGIAFVAMKPTGQDTTDNQSSAVTSTSAPVFSSNGGTTPALNVSAHDPLQA